MKFNRAKLYLESHGYIFEEAEPVLDWAREVSTVKREINAETDSFISKVKSWLKGLVSKVKKFFGMSEADARFKKNQKTGFRGPEWADMQPDEVYGYERAAAAKADHYGADKMGTQWQYCPNTQEYAVKAYIDGRCRDYSGCSWESWCTGKSASEIKSREEMFMRDWFSTFAKQYDEIAKQIKKKGTVTVFRGTGVGAWRDGRTYKDDAHFDDMTDAKKMMSKFRLMLRNAKLRNSWSMTPAVASRYATHHEIRYILAMECTMDEFSLPYSAWLEGHWKGHGARPAQWAANDEINVFQSFKVKDIKIIACGNQAQQLFRKITKTNCLKVDSTEPSNEAIFALIKTLKFEK